MSDLTISIEPPKPITVDFGGKQYKVRPIKSSLGIALAQRLQGEKDAKKTVEGIYHIIDIIFGKADSAKVKKRLEDPADDLDFPHVLQLMQALIAKSTGNPTM